uniref:Uncharacterized protein n=1 Tax=Anguilla anguilla TaxID=7936 RepID=A0A0E9S369_ANGAN
MCGEGCFCPNLSNYQFNMPERQIILESHNIYAIKLGLKS